MNLETKLETRNLTKKGEKSEQILPKIDQKSNKKELYKDQELTRKWK